MHITQSVSRAAEVSPDIFKAYDIRGRVDTQLGDAVLWQIGRALASQARAQRIPRLVVGYDGRHSSPRLAAALIEGICASGVDVVDIGQVPTPLVWFAVHHLKTGSGVMITGSHNPPEYNGVKMMLGGRTLAGESVMDLYRRIEAGAFADGQGSCQTLDMRDEYCWRIENDLKLEQRLNLVVDAGNGVGGLFGPLLYRRLGCRVRELFCEVDGNFPNHHPDPAKPENLIDLRHAVANTDAQFGLAFDGDADRLGTITKNGEVIAADRLLMLFASDVLMRNPGAKVVYDVKSSRRLAPWIRQHQGEPILERTGHSFIKARMQESGALLGGELSGHLFFADRWFGVDDGIYAGARLLELLSRTDDPNALLAALPQSNSTPEIQIPVDDGEAHALVQRLQNSVQKAVSKGTAGKGEVRKGARSAFCDAELITIDGLRAEFADGFGLVRASNTTPTLILRFEGDTPEALERIQGGFRDLLKKELGITVDF